MMEQEILCVFCSPTSTIPHDIQVTRLRITNLCCSGEEKIIRTCLENLKGVDSLAINVVGRYAVVKHCPVECCAPPQMLVDLLNEKYLGASIQDLGDEGEAEEHESHLLKMLYVLLIAAMFITALIIQLVYAHDDEVAMWIYIVSVIIGIWPIGYSSFVALFVRATIDINVLIVLAVIGALVNEEYFDSSLLVVLFQSTELIEKYVMARVRKAVQMSSSSTMPKNAILVDGSKVPTEDIKQGMVICVRAGEMILADGEVQKGEAVVHEAALTGECVPIHKAVGEDVRSGTIVHNGYVEVLVSKPAGESTLQRLQQEVSDVQADRGEIARIVDQFALYWTPLVLLAAMLYIISYGFTYGEWREVGERGLLILVLACPCAIVISAPIPAVCAIANASRQGVLIRGSTVVEHLALIDTVGLDKTGTLTKGFFKVTGRLVVAEDEDEGSAAMSYAAAIEEKSTHPLADAVVAEHVGCVAEMAEGALPNVRKVKVVDGVGVSGWVEAEEDDWRFCIVGNERILKKNGGNVRISKAQEAKIDKFISGASNSVCLFVAVEDELLLVLSLSDELRPESINFIRSLRSLGMSTTMLTGDSELAAKHFCSLLRIDASSCHFRLLPEEKLQWIRAMQHVQPKTGETMPSVPPGTGIRGAAGGAGGAGEGPLLQLELQLLEEGVSVDNTNDEHVYNEHHHDNKHQEEEGREEANDAMERKEWTKLSSSQSPDYENRFAGLAGSLPKHVLMVGDGINDSAALAAADVGVAMGAGGSAMAVTAADVVLMSENLQLIPGAIDLCREARRAMIHNCAFAIGIKIVAIALALSGYLQFWHAIIIDLGSLIVVVVNGMQVLNLRTFSKYAGPALAAEAAETEAEVTEITKSDKLEENFPLNKVYR